MPDYQVKNYDSVILDDMTVEKEGHVGSSLSKYSNKHIWVVCRFCGKPNRTKKSKYSYSGNSNAHKECRYLELKEVDSTWASQDVKDKIKATLIEKYGVDHSSKIEGIVDKRRQTFLKKYGEINPSKCDAIKEKKKQTLMKNYGVEFPLQSPDILKKAVNTLMARKGVEKPAQDKEIHDKMVETCLKNHGTENPMQNEQIVDKMKETFAKRIEDDPDGKYVVINILRDPDHAIWEDLKTMSLREISEKYNLYYGTLRSALAEDEFRDKYYQTYSFPRCQSQKKVAEALRQFYDGEIIENTKKIIPPLELDIYVPEKKFAIEFNGSFWHSEAFLDRKEARNKHLIKTQACRKAGIRLFHIFEHTWNTRQKQLLGFIRSILGANAVRVGARQCKLSETDYGAFVQENHIQGFSHALKFFNLEHNGEIVATMTAGKHHRQNVQGNPIVLSRLCFRDGVNVPGGTSKLFKKFCKWSKENGYDRIISWSDNSWTDGKIYDVLGFKLIKEHPPDYFYWDLANDCYLSKQSQKKSNTGCSKEMTERDWCFEHGLYRIWDCGKRLYEYAL